MNNYIIFVCKKLALCYNNMTCGVGLVVEHVLAKDETGVRFSYAAQNILYTNYK